MDATQEARLYKLADALFTLHKENPTKFDFAHVQNNVRDAEGKICGSTCCAMGYTPYVFPDLVWFSDNSTDYPNQLTSEFDFSTSLITDSTADEDGDDWTDNYRDGDKLIAVGYGRTAEVLFGITKEEANYLFTPSNNPVLFDGARLPHNATAHDVASRIVKFIEEYEHA